MWNKNKHQVFPWAPLGLAFQFVLLQAPTLPPMPTAFMYVLITQSCLLYWLSTYVVSSNNISQPTVVAQPNVLMLVCYMVRSSNSSSSACVMLWELQFLLNSLSVNPFQ